MRKNMIFIVKDLYSNFYKDMKNMGKSLEHMAKM